MFGFFLINKPKGITSHDVVGYLRKITGERTIGHAGTLDPLAEGLMIVAIGREFTKQISKFVKLDKEYIAEATLGATSTTYDAEGVIGGHSEPSLRHSGVSYWPVGRLQNRIIIYTIPDEARMTMQGKHHHLYDPRRGEDDDARKTSSFIRSWTSLRPLRVSDPEGQDDAGNQKDLSQEKIKKTLQSFLGEQQQMPPAFSAKKIGGKKAYDLARQGKAVELKPVSINISEIKLLDYQYPIHKFSVKVSSGTYIRSLVHDIGQTLHTGAYMSNLVRIKIGEWRLEQAQSLFEIKQLNDLINCKIDV